MKDLIIYLSFIVVVVFGGLVSCQTDRFELMDFKDCVFKIGHQTLRCQRPNEIGLTVCHGLFRLPPHTNLAQLRGFSIGGAGSKDMSVIKTRGYDMFLQRDAGNGRVVNVDERMYLYYGKRATKYGLAIDDQECFANIVQIFNSLHKLLYVPVQYRSNNETVIAEISLLA